MADKRIGLIGCGNMGSSIINGLLSSGLYPADRIMASARTQASLEQVSGLYSIQVTTDNVSVAKNSDILILAVKPCIYEDIIEEIRDFVEEDDIVISIAAGISHSRLDDFFGRPVKIVRAMPNTPAMVLEAMTALSPNDEVTPEEMKEITAVFESFGRAETVPESLMDAVTGISGSSPAYVYMLIEAMADAAVADGMPRTQAYTFAAQAVYGAAKMVLETKKHPGELKDAVCSPNGTTIAAVAKLEELGMRNAIISAQRCCTARSKEIGKSKQ